MKRALSLIGFAAAAALTGVVAYLYMNDREVQEKVNRAVMNVGDAVTQIKASVQNLRRAAGQEGPADAVARNQAWADEQWEALGI